MMELKYIMIEYMYGLYPVVFSAVLSHDQVASGINGKPVSAGFVRLRIVDDKIKVSCYGKSVTLKLEPNEEDVFFLEMLLNER